LGKVAMSGGLSLFPIVLLPCPWEQVELLRKVQIWSSARPVGEFRAETLDREFDEIARAIVAATTQTDHACAATSRTASAIETSACSETIPFARTGTQAGERVVAGMAGYAAEFCGVGGTGPVLDHLGVAGCIYLNNHHLADEKRMVTRDDAIDGRFLVLRKGRKTYHLVRVIGD
jgi:hypothetical protein